MTDATPGSTPDDELVSAHLDGEIAAEEAARLEQTPEFQARLDEFRRIAEAVARADHAPEGAADQAIAAALSHLPGAAAASPPRPDELGSRRARRRSTATLVLAAAAAVVVVALAAVGFTAFDDGERNDTAEVASDDASEGEASETAGDAESGAARSAAPYATEDAAGAPIVATDLDDLADQVNARIAGAGIGGDALDEEAGDDELSEESSASTTTGPIARLPECVPARATSRVLGETLVETTGSLAGEPVLVGAYTSPDGPVLVVVTQDCTLVEERLL